MNINDEVREIIQADYQKNHSGREYSVDTVYKVFNNLKLVDYNARKYGRVIIAYIKLSDSTVEFHCTNGGGTEDLIKAVNQFNTEMSDDYEWSVTYYDNPKINELLKHSVCPSEFTKIDQDIDKTYEAKFRLRGI